MAQGNVSMFYEFKILPTKELLYISKHCIDKAIPECNQDPVNPCPKVAEFFPLDKKRDITDCSYLKKAGLRQKAIRENRREIVDSNSCVMEDNSLPKGITCAIPIREDGAISEVKNMKTIKR